MVCLSSTMDVSLVKNINLTKQCLLILDGAQVSSRHWCFGQAHKNGNIFINFVEPMFFMWAMCMMRKLSLDESGIFLEMISQFLDLKCGKYWNLNNFCHWKLIKNVKYCFSQLSSIVMILFILGPMAQVTLLVMMKCIRWVAKL
jgi:hypothetical protein